MIGLLSMACGDDESVNKGIVDEDALRDGVPVTLSGNLGTVQVMFESPVPDVPEDDFEMAMDAAVSLRVRSTTTSNTADLADGTLVQSMPTQAGQFTWGLNSDGTIATLTFYNQTGGGLTLKAGLTYIAELQVVANDYVESVPPSTFNAMVN